MICVNNRVMSRNLGDFRREIIDFSNTASMINFRDHLIRNNCQDYDIEIISKMILDSANCQCGLCRSESQDE